MEPIKAPDDAQRVGRRVFSVKAGTVIDASGSGLFTVQCIAGTSCTLLGSLDGEHFTPVGDKGGMIQTMRTGNGFTAGDTFLFYKIEGDSDCECLILIEGAR